MKTDFATHLPSLATSHRNLVPGAGLSGEVSPFGSNRLSLSKGKDAEDPWLARVQHDQRSQSSGEKMSKKLRGCRCPLKSDSPPCLCRGQQERKIDECHSGLNGSFEFYSERYVLYCNRIKATPTFYFIKSINHFTG
ncbi:hypothetical protein CEXT_115551 [Caerostris extrusa]|uniref:Uncharacterized protein n=1 Tax=Caerostris extrusa TaxID=172846 RepID=A0AAV4TN52_CAEEX|nr:hypothetical protein CEXT_115551 [Caerostris extrusa]